MSTSKTYQQSLAEAGSETRAPMLETISETSYIPWASRFKRFLNRKRENRKWLLKALEDGPYVFRNITPTEPGESLVSVYNRFAQLMNDLERNNMKFPIVSVNTKFLNSLQPEWLKYVTQVRLAKKLTVDSFDDLFDYLSQFEKLVNASRVKKLEKSHGPLPLVAHTGSSSRNTSSYYVTHPPSVVDYDEEFEQADVHNHSEDPLASAMLLLAKAITQNFSNPTNNRLRASSNTRNQAVVQGDRVNIQNRNSGNVGRNNRRAYVQGEVVEGMNATNETANVQRIVRTPTPGNTSTGQCYNCGGKGHYARNYPKPRVRDSKYFMEQMLLAKQDEAGVILTDEQNDFLFADASRMEEIEELSANICLMARIQPADQNSDDEPSYESAFVSKVQSSSINENDEHMYPTHTKIINSTIDDDQINSNIQFDSVKGNVNSGSVEKDTHVYDRCALETLARNAYDEAAKQQRFAQKVQQQNMTLTSQIEMYKERNRVLENITKDNNYLKEFLEAMKGKNVFKKLMGNIEIPLNVRDSEETLEDAFKKSFVEQTCSSSSYIPFVKILETKTMPSELPLINELFNIKVGFEKLFLLIKQNSKRASMFYTSKEEIALNDFCRDQVKPLLNELLDYFDGFQNLFQRDIKEMKDAFEQNDVYLDEIERQNDLLKDQLLEASLKHDIELCVLLNHECVDKSLHDELEQVKKKSLEIQEGLKARIKILEKDVQRCEKQSVDFELKLQHEKEKHKWDSSKNKNSKPLDFSWISRIQKLEDENVSLDFKVQSLIKERDNAKMEYKKLFDSIKKTRSQTQKEMDELIAHVSEKTYAYGAIRAENQNLLHTISELKARMKNGENGKSVNTKFDKTHGSQSFLCVTPLNKNASQKQTVVLKTKENHVESKPVTLQTSHNKQTGTHQNTNVISPGMYRVVTQQESQTNKTKNVLSSTGMNATSSVKGPKSRDSHVKTSVLDVSKNEAKKEAVYVRKNKQTDNTFAKVVSNKENVIDVAVANASKAKTLLCVSCMQNVLIPCHDKCVAKHKLNVRSNARRTFFVNSRIPKSSKTTFVAPKTRFSEKATQSKTLDTTSVASKSKIDEASASKARDKVVQIVLWVVDNSCSKHMTGDRSLLRNLVENFIGTVRFRNDNFAVITCYGDYIHGNITICHVYYVERLGHNVFSVGQFCDGDLEVAFRSNTCYVRNLEGDDLLIGGRDLNLYTISISDMAASSPICLMSKATSTKSWLWHRRLSHLNFGTINDLTKLDLVDGLPKFKYGKDHLCSACERGKSKKASHPPKLIPSDYSKLELLHMDLCGPMRVASVNGKKYILVIVDDFSRFTWVYFLRSKDETPEIIKKFIAQAQLNYKAKVCKIRTDNGTEFKNATLKAYYEKLGIMQQFSIARTPQQNGVVERRNRTLVEAARTMLIFSRLPEFLWAKAVATACFTQNRSIINTRHNKTPYELLRGRKPNVEYFHVFGSLCYPTNDRNDLGKMKHKQ
ncbi:retrovirus-related pol polyprotein from transposon TNT 1-94 [Tanacetum coccineum]